MRVACNTEIFGQEAFFRAGVERGINCSTIQPSGGSWQESASQAARPLWAMITERSLFRRHQWLSRGGWAGVGL